jgi:methylated-DNA-[protein]-cysteine S-methyltransferase
MAAFLKINKSKFKSKIGFIYYLWTDSGGSGERIIFLSNKKESFDRYIEKLKIKYRVDFAGNPQIKNNPSADESLKTLLLNELKSEKIENAIIDYLSGKLKETGIKPYFLTGSEFEKKVWNSAASIPYGSTISYKELAQKAGHPLACRAAGTAMKNNPVMLVVPCHRVIKSNGKLGNFGGGAEIKFFLVNLEASRR